MISRTMEPYEAINSLEGALRGLIRDVLGDGWKDSLIDSQKLEQRRAEEAARRQGAAVQQSLLAYTHLYEMRGIIHRNWEKFKPALMDKKRFDVYMDRIEDFRNAPMHSRDLLPFERALLAGISGEIRNLTTLYRSQQGPDRKHYPVMESITDSFGKEFDASAGMAKTGVRLQVGDQVEFVCRAWDVQDRELTWTLESWSRSAGIIDRKKGVTVTLSWTVTDEFVGEDADVVITMSSDGKYHRSKHWDDAFTVRYSVDPPAT